MCSIIGDVVNPQLQGFGGKALKKILTFLKAQNCNYQKYDGGWSIKGILGIKKTHDLRTRIHATSTSPYWSGHFWNQNKISKIFLGVLLSNGLDILTLKRYLRYKTILCHKVALDV